MPCYHTACTRKEFHRWYRMTKELFTNSVNGVRVYDTCFVIKKYVVGVFGIS
jgi:hypothetical protein